MARYGPLESEWAQYQEPAYAFFRRMGLDPHRAADLAQETLLRALQGAHRYRGEGSVRAWVLGIARNLLREWLRSARREVPMASVVDSGGTETFAGDWVDVDRALARLDPDHREVLVLRFVLDLPSRDVAGALGISDDAVRSRVARAKADFRRVWSP